MLNNTAILEQLESKLGAALSYKKKCASKSVLTKSKCMCFNPYSVLSLHVKDLKQDVLFYITPLLSCYSHNTFALAK